MGVKLGTYDSKTDWSLDFLGYSISIPEAKTNTVSIPLRDGVIDMTEALGGAIRYENRSIVMRFEIRDQRANWPTKMHTILSAIHGQIIDVQLPDDTTNWWHGRCSVGELQDNTSTASIEISLDSYPFKHGTTYTQYGPYTVSGEEITVSIPVISDRAFLAFDVTGTITVEFDSDEFGFNDAYTFSAGCYADNNIAYTITVNGTEYALLANIKQIPGLILNKGTNSLILDGNGTITIYVVGGAL